MLILDEKKHFYGSVLMKIINSRFEYLNMSRVHKTPRKKVWFIINCRYKESKEIKAGLKELKIAIANPSCDNEVLRDYFLKLIRKFVFSALDEIYSFKTEKEILARMAQMGQQSFFFNHAQFLINHHSLMEFFSFFSFKYVDSWLKKALLWFCSNESY